jgi:hypothetical protein
LSTLRAFAEADATPHQVVIAWLPQGGERIIPVILDESKRDSTR